MQTVLVNPRRSRRRAPKSGSRRAPQRIMVLRANGSPAMANPRRRRRARRNPSPLMMANPRRRRARRRNPAPLIMPNPRRRRARRNPTLSLMGGLKTGAIALGAGAAAYGINKYLLADIGHNENEHWNSQANRNGVLMRSGIRFAIAAAASFLLPGSIGAAFGGAMLYPAAYELENWYRYRNAGTAAGVPELATPLDPYRLPANIPAATAADLEADLAAQLNGRGYVYQ